MYTERNAQGECNKSVVTQLTRGHIGYIGSVYSDLGPQCIPCGTGVCATTR